MLAYRLRPQRWPVVRRRRRPGHHRPHLLRAAVRRVRRPPNARSRRSVGYPETPEKPMRPIFSRVVMAVTEAGVPLPNTVLQHSDGGDHVQRHRIDHRKHGLRLGDLPWFHDRRVRTPGPDQSDQPEFPLACPGPPPLPKGPGGLARSDPLHDLGVVRSRRHSDSRQIGCRRPPCADPGNNDRRRDQSSDRFPGAGLATPSMHPFRIPRPLPLQLLDRLHDPHPLALPIDVAQVQELVGALGCLSGGAVANCPCARRCMLALGVHR